MTQHCTIMLDCDMLGIRARARDGKLIIDVPDDRLLDLRRAVVAEVDGLRHDLVVAGSLGTEKKHLTECYLVMWPDDEGGHCTCRDYGAD